MRRVWGITKMGIPKCQILNKNPLYFQTLSLIFLILLMPTSSQTWDGTIVTESDYQSLQAFKHDLVDPNGALSSWNYTASGACSGAWAGIKCAQGQVIVIQLPWRGLSGRISENIGQFQALRKLSLHDNSIGGAVPTSLGFLPNLRGVQLFNNRLSGTVPASLGLCPLLRTLELGNNSLSGTIPDNLGNSTMLLRLSLGHNFLSGPLPVGLTQSPSLLFLSLENNSLSGPIPEGIGNLSGLRTLDLSGNLLNGSLPDSLFTLKNLSVLNLSNNQLDGQIPYAVGGLSLIRDLDLSHNWFSGEIPDFLGALPNLESFNASYNNLSGSVPKDLSHKFNSSAFIGNLHLCGYTDKAPCLPSMVAAAPSPSHRQRQKLSAKDVILIVLGILCVTLMATCCILLCCLLRKGKIIKEARGQKGVSPSATEVGETGGKLVHFDGHVAFGADDLLCAGAEVLGKSTYGTVYKATMENGVQVAVKRLREKIAKGQKEFESEVNDLGKVRHPNLLAIRAYYLGPKGEKLLVSDYMPRGNLASFLHARGHGVLVDWPTRMKITKGIARGLLHLHTNVGIVHGNLTSSNVLLDEHMNVKVGDFGLSRLMTEVANANAIATAGAMGYRAPELLKLKKATTKSDVYSFGVIMLELLTGRSPGEAVSGVDFPRWVASIVKEEWTNEVFDFELLRDASAVGDELLSALKLALHCIDLVPSVRPEAAEILRKLEETRAEADGESSSSGD